MLPKFLLADNSQEMLGKLYVVHNEAPRFILEGSDDDFSEDQVMHWIDDAVKNEAEVAKLIQAAEDFLDSELMFQEELFDELED
jgi:hypothetical protein